MSSRILLPTDVASVRPATLCLVDADYPQVLELCVTLWASAVRDCWIAYRELPCLLDTAAVDTYAGEVQFGVMGQSVASARQTRLWTTQSDGAASLLTKLSIRLQCRVISTTFCPDWSGADALGALTVMDGSSAFKQRIVQVMRSDNGRLEYFEQGDPLDFERTENYAKRLLKERISESVLLSYWRQLGVDVAAELADWVDRPGIAYVMANRLPLAVDTVLRAV